MRAVIITAAAVALIAILLLARARTGGPQDAGDLTGSGEREAESGQTRLIFAAGGAPSEISVWRSMLAEFEEQNPDITVELRELPANSDQQHSYYTTLLGSGSADVDVMRLDVVWLPEFHAAGWLHPLAEGIEGNLLPFAESVDVYESQWYAIPWNLDVGLLYYRKDLLDRAGVSPPKTWEELLTAVEAVRPLDDAPSSGYVWQGRQYEGLTCNYLEHVVSRGGGLDARQELNEDAHLAALEYMRALVEDGISPRDTGSAMDEERCRELFQRGDAVFMRNWPYAWALLNSDESPVAGRVGVAPLPAGEDGESAGTLGGWHLGIASGCKDTAAAYQLVMHLTAANRQVDLAQTLSWLPTRQAAWDDPALAEQSPAVAVMREPALSAVARPALPNYPQLSLAVQEQVNRVVTGLATPQQAWDALRPELERAAQ